MKNSIKLIEDKIISLKESIEWIKKYPQGKKSIEDIEIEINGYEKSLEILKNYKRT